MMRTSFFTGMSDLKGIRQVVSRRIDNLDKAFDKLLEVAGVDGLIFKDLRKYFNHILVSRYGQGGILLHRQFT